MNPLQKLKNQLNRNLLLGAVFSAAIIVFVLVSPYGAVFIGSTIGLIVAFLIQASLSPFTTDPMLSEEVRRAVRNSRKLMDVFLGLSLIIGFFVIVLGGIDESRIEQTILWVTLSAAALLMACLSVQRGMIHEAIAPQNSTR